MRRNPKRKANLKMKMTPKTRQDLGLHCQTPLKDLKFTVTVGAWPLSFNFSLCFNGSLKTVSGRVEWWLG